MNATAVPPTVTLQSILVLLGDHTIHQKLHFLDCFDTVMVNYIFFFVGFLALILCVCVCVCVFLRNCEILKYKRLTKTKQIKK